MSPRNKIIEMYKKNKIKFDEYHNEMGFIRDTYKKYNNSYQILFKVEGKLLNIDKTLDHYEKVLYNIYVEYYEIQEYEKLYHKMVKILKNN